MVMLLVIVTLMMILMRLTMIGDTWVDQAECWKELVAVRDLRDAFGILDQHHCPSCWWSRPGLVNSILLVLVTLVTNLSTSSPSEPQEETSWCFRPSITCGRWRWLRSGDFEKNSNLSILGQDVPLPRRVEYELNSHRASLCLCYSLSTFPVEICVVWPN